MSFHIDFMGRAPGGRPIVSGRSLFMMKDTMGFPLSMSLAECEERAWAVDWVGFIEAACAHGWGYDQAYEEIKEALKDSNAFKRQRSLILRGLQHYVIREVSKL